MKEIIAAIVVIIGIIVACNLWGSCGIQNQGQHCSGCRLCQIPGKHDCCRRL